MTWNDRKRNLVFIAESFRIIAALFAAGFAIRWKRNDFPAGLIIPPIWSVLDAISIMSVTLLDEPVVNASRFGFIIPALVSFIPGMQLVTAISRPSG